MLFIKKDRGNGGSINPSIFQLFILIFLLAFFTDNGHGEEVNSALINRYEIEAESGICFLNYKEKSAGVNSEFDSAGLSVNIAGKIGLPKKFGMGGSYTGYFVAESTETFHTGLPLIQINDSEVNQNFFEANFFYTLSFFEKFELDLLGGYHYFKQNFTRSNFRFKGFESSNLGKVNEDFTGSGPELGLRIYYSLHQIPLFFSINFSQFFITNFETDNSLLGKMNSKGFSNRWSLGTFYHRKQFSIGLKYIGFFMRIDEAQRDNIKLPKNETLINSFLLVGTYVF